MEENLQVEVLTISKDDQLFKSYYLHWKAEIQNYFPDFSPEDAELCDFLMLNYENQNVGLFVYQAKGEELHIEVDFVPPAFRYIGIGPSFFKSMKVDFLKQGFTILYAITNNAAHRKYLVDDLHFTASDKHPDLYFLDLK